MKLKKVQEKKLIAETSMYSHPVLYKFQVQKVVQKYKFTKKKKSSRRRNELSIHHLMINAEL